LRVLFMACPPRDGWLPLMPFFLDRSERLVLVLDDLNDQLREFLPSLHQHAAASRRGAVVPPPLSPHHLRVTTQVAELFHLFDGRRVFAVGGGSVRAFPG